MGVDFVYDPADDVTEVWLISQIFAPHEPHGPDNFRVILKTFQLDCQRANKGENAHPLALGSSPMPGRHTSNIGILPSHSFLKLAG